MAIKLYKTNTKPLLIVAAIILIGFIVVLLGRPRTSLTSNEDLGNAQNVNTEAIFPSKSNATTTKPSTPQQQVPSLYNAYESSNPPSYEKANIAKALLIDDLPFTVPFFASNGKRLTITMYTLPTDPTYLVRAKILGINYEQSEANQETNPEAKAFVEAFNFLKKRIESYGIDPYSLYYVFGTRDYVAETANKWVKEFGLL